METTNSSSRSSASSSPPSAQSIIAPDEVLPGYRRLQERARAETARLNQVLDPDAVTDGPCAIGGCQVHRHTHDSQGVPLAYHGKGVSWLLMAFAGMAACILGVIVLGKGAAGWGDLVWGAVLMIGMIASFVRAIPDGRLSDRRRNIEYHTRVDPASVVPVKEYEVLLRLVMQGIDAREELARSTNPFRPYLQALAKGKKDTQAWLEEAKKIPVKDRLPSLQNGIDRTQAAHDEYAQQEATLRERENLFFSWFDSRRELVRGLRSPLSQLDLLERLQVIERNTQDLIDNARAICEASVDEISHQLRIFAAEHLAIGEIVASAITNSRSDAESIQAIQECVDRASRPVPVLKPKQAPKSTVIALVPRQNGV
jgi:hypothetical protein